MAIVRLLGRGVYSGAYQAGGVAVIGVSIDIWIHTLGVPIVRPLHRNTSNLVLLLPICYAGMHIAQVGHLLIAHMLDIEM